MPKEYRGGGKLGKWVLVGHVFPTSYRSDVMLLLHTTVINYLVSIEMTVLLECLIAQWDAAPCRGVLTATGNFSDIYTVQHLRSTATCAAALELPNLNYVQRLN